ncbi:MAG: metallopeptidase family protein [Tissierellia bacterium]|nr:metallopeptidase family protein [Tissierellia bacterium]
MEFYSMEEIGFILDEIMEEMDPRLFRDLYGGVNLSPKEKLHPKRLADDYYILGEYVRDGMSSYIMIYYGSLQKVYSYVNKNQIKEKLQELLDHELTHHLEYLAGEKDLEIEDKLSYAEYVQKHLEANNE